MARKANGLVIKNSLEPTIGAPLDGRQQVKVVQDLHAEGSYPKYYNGMIVSVKENGDAYKLSGVPTEEASWKRILTVDDLDPYDDTALTERVVDLEAKSIPSKTSELQNDSGYITADDVPAPYDDTALAGRVSANEIAIADRYTKAEADAKIDVKQDVLVSGTDIKTINGESVLGQGDIKVEGGDNRYVVVRDVATLEQVKENREKELLFVRDTGNAIAPRPVLKADIDPEGDIAVLCIYAGGNTIEEWLVDDIGWELLKSWKFSLTESLSEKQPLLVSGVNIKTVNGESLLGEGNIEVGGSGTIDAYTKTETDALLNNKANQSALIALQNTAEDLRLANESIQAELTELRADITIDLGGIIERLDADETAIADRYTKEEVDNLVSTINGLDIVPVVSLPKTNIRKDCIYLIKDSLTENDLYSEYIYIDVDGEEKWERFGSATIAAEPDAVVNTMIAEVFGTGGGTGGDPGTDPEEP